MTVRHLLLSTDAVGGVWTYATDLARALTGHDIHTTLTVVGPAPSEEQRRNALGIAGLTLEHLDATLDWCADRPEQIADASAAIFALARRRRADLVQLHTPTLAIASDRRVPIISVLHSCQATWWRAIEGGAMPDDFRWRTDLLAKGMACSDDIIVPSEAFAQSVRACYGLSRPPSVVHNGRPLRPVETRAMDDCVLTAGRLWDKAKNAETMDAAAERLAVPFKAAGHCDGPGGEALPTRHLCLLGQMENEELSQLMAARPIFVSAARYEPFGLAVLEAAMAGCPLVLSDIPTFRELWSDAAIFVPPLDAPAFATAIEALIGDPHARLKLGASATRRARAYSIEATARNMVRIYEALLPGRRRDAA